MVDYETRVLDLASPLGNRVTADTALRLPRYFNTDLRFWLNAQVGHDLYKAESEMGYPGRAA
jgi:plasmid maintenance system antidote protein VapI